MVEADRPHHVVPGEVVLVGGVIAVPADDVERGVIEFDHEEPPVEFHIQLTGLFCVLEGGDRVEEVAGIGKAVGPDRAPFGDLEVGAVVFTDVAA